MRQKKLFKLGFLILIGIVALLTIANYLRLAKQRKAKTKAIEESAVASAGYPNFIPAEDYGKPTAEIGVAATTAENGVQNIQAPSISGFSSDLFTGGATINYPLNLPAGRGGLTPSLSLTYSSNSVYDSVLGRDVNGDHLGLHNMDDIHGRLYVSDHGESWYDQLITQSSQIGLGWDISGLGYVFRDSLNRYTLVLNGQSYRLFKTLKENGAAEETCEGNPIPTGEWSWCLGKWHTDPTSFLKIQHKINPLVNDEPDKDGAAPENFKITDSNGTVYIFEPKGYFWKRCDYRDFGCRSDDRSKQEKWATFYNKWVLTKVVDVHGNEMSIDYNNETEEVPAVGASYPRAVYPAEINYSGRGSEFNTKVKFEFFDRLDWKNLRGSGVQTFFSKKRIGKIDIQVRKGASWETVHHYELDNNQYFESVRDTACKGPASSDGFCLLHPKLRNITAKGRDGSSLPSYTFHYYDISDDSDVDPDAISGNGRESSSVDGYNNFRLLHSANNGYGGKVEYNYENYTVKDYDPKTGDSLTGGSIFGLHRIVEKITYDGQGNSFRTTYNYPKHTVGISDDKYHSGFESVGHNLVSESLFNKNGGSKIRETKYYFIQGKTEGNKFYVWPERGSVWKTEIFDGQDKLLSVSENDYLREPAQEGANQRDVWETPHFIAAKESRSCQDSNSSSAIGNKTTYSYKPEDQNGQQWGNLTETTAHLVNNCDFAGASAYRSTHNTYFPNLESHITNRVAETEIFAWEAGVRTKRLAASWNIYDENVFNDPKKTPGNKGQLTLGRTFYKFPEAANTNITSHSEDTIDTKYEYYDFGALKSTTTYDSYGSSSSTTAGGGTARTSTIAYDSTYNTFPVLTKNPLLHTSETFYKNGAELVNHPYLADRTITKDVNGQLWTTLVDGLGRTKESYFPGDTVGETPARVKIEYNDVNKDSVNKLIVHTQTRDDKDEATSNATYLHGWQFYNGLGQVIESQTEKESDGAKVILTSQKYNTLGQVEVALIPYETINPTPGAFIEPSFNRPERTETEYDELGRVIKSVAPGNRVTEAGYYGRKTAVLDPNKHLATTEVDNLGRTINARVFKGNRSLATPDDYYAQTKFTYDHLDRLTKTTNTKGNVTENFYNQFGQKIETKDPDLGNWKYTYDATGQLKTVTDAKLQVKSFVYDKLGRLTKKYVDSTLQPDGTVVHGTLTASFIFDDCPNGTGRLCHDETVNNPQLGFIGTKTRYTYDIKGRLVSEMKTIDDTPYTTSYVYDSAGRQKEIIYPDSDHEKVAYTYNDAGLLNTASSSARQYLTSVEYNALGMPISEMFGNQTKNSYTYEPLTYRLQSKTVTSLTKNTDLWSQKLAYDPVGNITNITYPLRKDFPGLPFKINYSYDELNRLTGSQIAGLTDEAAKKIFYTRYTYDELGRMSFKQEEGEDKESCKKVIVNNVKRSSTLIAENLSEIEGGYITFNFYDKNGKELFFVGDSVKPKNDSTDLGKRSFVPVLVDVISDIRSKYPNYEGYVVVESHKQIDYPGKQDGPCIKVLSGTPQELCQINPQRYSFLCPTPTPTITQ